MKKLLLLMGLMAMGMFSFAQNKEDLQMAVLLEKKAFLEAVRMASSFLTEKMDNTSAWRDAGAYEREKIVLSANNDMIDRLQLEKHEDQLVARALNKYMDPKKDFAVDVAFDNVWIESYLEKIKGTVAYMENGKVNESELLKALVPLVVLTNIIKEGSSHNIQEVYLIEVYMGRVRFKTKDKYSIPLRDFLFHHRDAIMTTEYSQALSTFFENVEEGQKVMYPLVGMDF